MPVFWIDCANKLLHGSAMFSAQIWDKMDKTVMIQRWKGSESYRSLVLSGGTVDKG